MSSLNQCKSIVFDNFERYHAAYTTVKSLQDNLEFKFLQKKYSNELIIKLYNENKLSDSKYIDFLINRYLKVLDTRYLLQIEWKVVCKKFSEIGASLENVTFDFRRWQEVICHLCNLLHVTFYFPTDSLIDSIAKFCPKIQSIEIYFSKISSEGFQVLSCQADGNCACPDLREIIFHPDVFSVLQEEREELIAYSLQNLTMLEHLECRILPRVLYSIHKDHMHSLNNIKPYNLTKLSLIDYNPGYKLDDLLKICVSVCPSIKSLQCYANSEEHLNLCSKFPNLQELWLKNVEEYVLGIDKFLKLKGNSLTSLKVSNVCFSSITLLSNCSRLNTLKMNSVFWLQNENSNEFCVIHTLKELLIKNLTVFHQPGNEEVVHFLSSFPNLERLELHDAVLNDPEVRVTILRAVKLQYLHFSNFISPDFLQDILSTCTSLTTLNLRKSDITDPDEGRVSVSVEELKDIARKLKNKPVILCDSDDPDFTINEDLELFR